MRRNDPLERRNDGRMVNDATLAQRLFPLLHRGEELLLVCHEAPQGFVDEPGLRAPCRRGQAVQLGIEIGVNACCNGDGLRHRALLLFTMFTLYTQQGGAATSLCTAAYHAPANPLNNAAMRIAE